MKKFYLLLLEIVLRIPQFYNKLRKRNGHLFINRQEAKLSY